VRTETEHSELIRRAGVGAHYDDTDAPGYCLCGALTQHCPRNERARRSKFDTQSHNARWHRQALDGWTVLDDPMCFACLSVHHTKDERTRREEAR
jgi:hypothetical protein